MIIYKITNNINGKAYIGQTVQPFKRRLSQHRENRKSLISLAIKKYGWENFTAEILEECHTSEELDERERYYIAFFNTVTPNGYNLTDGSNHCTASEETRRKQSEAAKRRFQNQAERDKISRKLNGRTDSDEVKAHKSAAQKKRYAENLDACQIQSEGLRRRFSDPAEREKQSAAMKAYHAEHTVSDETRKKLSDSKKEYWSDPENRAKQSERALLREPPSQETRDKISQSLKEYYANLKATKEKEDQYASKI